MNPSTWLSPQGNKARLGAPPDAPPPLTTASSACLRFATPQRKRKERCFNRWLGMKNKIFGRLQEDAHQEGTPGMTLELQSPLQGQRTCEKQHKKC
jgi:hypothetical protein